MLSYHVTEMNYVRPVI